MLNYYTRCLKNIPDVFSYNSRKHYWIFIIFGRNITKKAGKLHGFCVWYRGEFTVGNETYSVEPVDETLSGQHRVYRESDSIGLQSNLRCGT